ncbi:phage tail protein [Enterobacter roggenkampii]|uniref:phage tail protein n=1 Tax=Enterobacter roggenkampii TaxID=1812935 RepID=UPI0028168D09|nr:phage tail protein [Enterobacter roggenkampii]
MATKYFALLTNIGAAKLANATALGAQVEITQMAVGDGNGVLPTPNPAQTALTHELRRAQLNMLTIDPVNTNQIIAEQVIPEDAGGWWIREIGLFDKDGDMIAVANCAETYKPQLQEGSGRVQVIRVILIVSSTEAVTLKIDPSVVLATRKYVDDAVIEVKAYADEVMKKHVAAENPHKQYPLIANALKEMVDAGLVNQILQNLGLGTAKFVTNRGRNANGVWVIWSDGAIEMMGYGVTIDNGLATVNYPIELPDLTRYISIAERLAGDSGAAVNYSHTSMVIDSLTTKAGFKARCTMSATGNPSSNGFSWRVYYAPV